MRRLPRMTISTRGRFYSHTRGSGREKGKGIEKEGKGKGKGKEKGKNTRSEFGSLQEGWIDIGSGVELSVTLKSQFEYIKKNTHVCRNFI